MDELITYVKSLKIKKSCNFWHDGEKGSVFMIGVVNVDDMMQFLFNVVFIDYSKDQGQESVAQNGVM